MEIDFLALIQKSAVFQNMMKKLEEQVDQDYDQLQTYVKNNLEKIKLIEQDSALWVEVGYQEQLASR